MIDAGYLMLRREDYDLRECDRELLYMSTADQEAINRFARNPPRGVEVLRSTGFDDLLSIRPARGFVPCVTELHGSDNADD